MPAENARSTARTTVVVVTWHGLDIVGGCLDALAAQTTPHRVLVVDNASTDGTAGVLARHPSQPRVLRLRRNAGFAGALAAALPLVDTPYLAWLNDDVEPAPGWLAELEACLHADRSVAAAASALMLPDGGVQSFGVQLTRLGYGADHTEPPPAGDVFGFCGGAALLRAGVLRAVGGVPAPFFCYYEDTDTAWRLRLAGHRVAAVPGAAALHRHGATAVHGSARFHHWNERNRLLTLLRCAPAAVVGRELARFVAITAALPVRRIVGTGVPDAANYRLTLRLGVLADVLARLPATLVTRVRIGRRAAVGRRALWRRWAGVGE